MNTNSFPYEYVLRTLSTVAVELRSLSAQLQDAQPATDIAALRTRIQYLQHLVSDTLSVLRIDFSTLDTATEPAAAIHLDDLLSHLVEETAERLGLASRLSFTGTGSQDADDALSPPVRLLLYLVTREALSLAALHPSARHLSFSLADDQTMIHLRLEDDGLPLADSALLVETGSKLPTGLNDASPAPDPALPFFQRSSADAVSGAGNVRGLSLQPDLADLRLRVTQLGGSLEVGSTATANYVQLQLPLARAADGYEYTPLGEVRTSGSVAGTSPSSVSTDLKVPIRVLIVDGQAIVRAGLHRLLESYPDVLVVGEAIDSLQAVSETLDLGPQVVLLDARLAGDQNLDTVRRIKQMNLDAKILILAVREQEEHIYAALRAGADGYILKDIAPDELVHAIRSVVRGEVAVQAQLAGRLLSRFSRTDAQRNHSSGSTLLTAREREVLQLLARGLRNKEIAARLTVSERTVHFHLANIYQKLQASGRTEALRKALEQGMVTTS